MKFYNLIKHNNLTEEIPSQPAFQDGKLCNKSTQN